ncbi:MAG: LCCL domain-containing protein [Sphaerochaeta sp.]|uniref:LCCL domain-containing protein n=1 Tax=Sphaerochaeta sp. TaxID=1972642 RepID=UPI002FCAF233
MNKQGVWVCVFALILSLVGCTSGSFELGAGGPNLSLEYSSEAANQPKEEAQPESTQPTAKGTLPSQDAWEQTAGDYSNVLGDRITIVLPPNGYASSLWGVGIYTTDSSIGSAAVQMGLISFEQGGEVTIQITEGRPYYGGLLVNDVASTPYDSWPLSFQFVGKNGTLLDSTALQPIPINYLTTVVALGLTSGQSLQVALPAGGSSRDVWGSNPYSNDSSIGSAAVHAGLITFAQGGVVTVKQLGKMDAFLGSEANGVETYDYEGALEAFTFRK